MRNKKSTESEPARIVLVYQAGIANVFTVSSFNLSDYGRDARRLIQSDFRTCEAFARGAAAVGAVVRTAVCNQAGDITNAHWSDHWESAPFFTEMRPVYLGGRQTGGCERCGEVRELCTYKVVYKALNRHHPNSEARYCDSCADVIRTEPHPYIAELRSARALRQWPVRPNPELPDAQEAEFYPTAQHDIDQYEAEYE